MKSLSTWLAAIGIFLLSATGNFAQTNTIENGIIEKARADCGSFENGILEFDTQKAISEVELTGDDNPEKIVDFTNVTCSSSASFFCGTGGCGLTVIVNKTPVEFLAKAWKVEKATDGTPILKLAVHWSECDYKDTCWETYKWDGKALASLGAKAE